MAEDQGDFSVENNEMANRFQVQARGSLAFIKYARSGQQIVFTHTEVPEEMEGQGIGSRLAKAALDYARKHHLNVVPMCPFVAQYIRRHKEYEPLVHHNTQE